MNIWIYQTGEPLHVDRNQLRPMRAINLANFLVDKGHDVTIWSSAFFHQKKEHRCKKFSELVINDKLTIKLIPSRGYKKNIGVGRLYDHFQLAVNLYAQLKSFNGKYPDVAFIGYPPIEANFILGKWLSKNKIPFLLDVKDQWPHIFIRKLPVSLKPIGKIIFQPYFSCGRALFTEAAAIVSISQSFLKWSQDFAKREAKPEDIVAPLTLPKNQLDDLSRNQSINRWANQGVVLDGSVPVFCFVGSLSNSFDFQPIIDVAMRFKSQNIRAQFVIAGDGELYSQIKNSSEELDNVIMPGWISEPDISTLLSSATASLAPYRNTSDFEASIPNKVIDAMAYGLPLLSSLKGEVKSLIDDYEIGFFYDTKETLLQHCLMLSSDKAKTKTIRKSVANCYDKEFNFHAVYLRLVSLIENIGKPNNER